MNKLRRLAPMVALFFALVTAAAFAQQSFPGFTQLEAVRSEKTVCSAFTPTPCKTDVFSVEVPANHYVAFSLDSNADGNSNHQTANEKVTVKAINNEGEHELGEMNTGNANMRGFKTTQQTTFVFTHVERDGKDRGSLGVWHVVTPLETVEVISTTTLISEVTVISPTTVISTVTIYVDRPVDPVDPCKGCMPQMHLVPVVNCPQGQLSTVLPADANAEALAKLIATWQPPTPVGDSWGKECNTNINDR